MKGICKTRDDRFFVLMHLVEGGVHVSRLNCMIYVYQMLGFNLEYQYRLGVSGIRSKGFSVYLEEQIAKGVLEQKKGVLTLANDDVLCDFALTYEDFEVLDRLDNVINEMSDNTLYMLCVLDLVMSNVVSKNGLQALITSRDFIESSVSNLCVGYSEQEFNRVAGILRILRKELVFHG